MTYCVRNSFSIKEYDDSLNGYWFDITDEITELLGDNVAKAEIRMFLINKTAKQDELESLFKVYDPMVTELKRNAINWGKFDSTSKIVEICFKHGKQMQIRGTKWSFTN